MNLASWLSPEKEGGQKINRCDPFIFHFKEDPRKCGTLCYPRNLSKIHPRRGNLRVKRVPPFKLSARMVPPMRSSTSLRAIPRPMPM